MGDAKIKSSKSHCIASLSLKYKQILQILQILQLKAPILAIFLKYHFLMILKLLTGSIYK